MSIRDQFKEKVVQVLFKVYLAFFGVYLGIISRCQKRHRSAVFCKAYIQTFELFPDNKLKRNSEISFVVMRQIFEIPLDEDLPALDDDQVNVLSKTLISDKQVREIVSRYFLLEALFFSSALATDLMKEKADNAFEKAKKYVGSASAISYDDVSRINKDIKSDIRNLKKEMRILNSKRVEAEKLRIIKPVTITSSNMMFLASVFSTLFLISGFAYNKFFFGNFGINVGDFFSISDYIASSVDILAVTIISTVFGVASFFWGMSHALSAELHAEQFETEEKGKDYVIPLIIGPSVVGLVVHSYRTSELHGIFLFILILFVGVQILPRLPIWKYIDNRASVGAVLISVLYFALNLAFSVRDKLRIIESGQYESAYSITFRQEYKKYAKHSFVAGNSSYVFLLDKDNGKIVVIPKNGVESYYIK